MKTCFSLTRDSLCTVLLAHLLQPLELFPLFLGREVAGRRRRRERNAVHELGRVVKFVFLTAAAEMKKISFRNAGKRLQVGKKLNGMSFCWWCGKKWSPTEETDAALFCNLIRSTRYYYQNRRTTIIITVRREWKALFI